MVYMNVATRGQVQGRTLEEYPRDEVREPPLPEDGSKDDFPGKDDLIDPNDGGGRIKKNSIEVV